MRTVLFYCQHLLGVGHLSRSLSICHAFLAKGYHVTFLQGGPEIGKNIEHKNYKKVQLPPLLMSEETSELYDPKNEKSVADIFNERQTLINEICKNKYDIVITELFPFGRNKFKNEVFHLLDQISIYSPKVLKVSSVRDILVEKQNSDERSQKIQKIIQEKYDYVLVHSDEHVIKLDETFSRAAALKNQLLYTGFVNETGQSISRAKEIKKEILVSFGGGVVGDELALAVAQVAPHFSDYQFRFIFGPYTSNELSLKMKTLMTKNISIETFLSDFEKQLSAVALSISMAGYNTVMNILSTGVPALVYPYDANHEQKMRATKLESLGLLKVLDIEDFKSERLIALIQEWLHQQIPQHQIKIDGSKQSVELLDKILNEAQK